MKINITSNQKFNKEISKRIEQRLKLEQIILIRLYCKIIEKVKGTRYNCIKSLKKIIYEKRKTFKINCFYLNISIYPIKLLLAYY